ncbi:MAG: MATE family efflux transporter [Desulfobacterium sp.]
MSFITHKSYLAVAIPFTISTVTQPLLGAVDTAVVGRLENASYLGGVAIGTVIFNTLYWLFGFLRVSTSGFSAQSLGSDTQDDSYYAFLRPFVMALFISMVFILFQYPIIKTAIHIYHPAPNVTRHAMTYFTILIWGAPFVLINYVSLGWLMGRKHIKESLFLQISTNFLNIILNILFVLIFKMEVAGVAWGSLISQCYDFGLGIFLISKKLDFTRFRRYRSGLLQGSAMKKLVGVNGDLLIRTLCLLIMTNMFVAKGSKMGASFLAANAVLFQIQYIIAYFFDGLANAGSVFVGKSVGEKNLKEFKRTVTISNIHLVWLSLSVSVLLLLFQHPLIRCFTDLTEIVSLCNTYMIWLIIYPFIIGIGLVYYGFFTGATCTAPIRNSMIIALLVFITTYYTAVPVFHNHGLWLAFILFSLCRSGMLFFYRKKLIQARFLGNNY